MTRIEVSNNFPAHSSPQRHGRSITLGDLLGKKTD